jgi:hypothetical protein
MILQYAAAAAAGVDACRPILMKRGEVLNAMLGNDFFDSRLLR